MLDVLSGVPTPQGVGSVVNEERDPKRMRLEQPFSDEKIPSYGRIDPDIKFQLEEELPSMAEAYKNKDWFILQKYISSAGFSLDIEQAVKSEFAAISVWFLLCEFSPHIKVGAAHVLESICFGTSKAPNVSDKESVENLVSRVLCDGGSAEVKRQVCLAISFLTRCSNDCLVLRFGAAIQDGLLQLIRDPCCSSELTFPLITAIANIAIVSNGMREKILESELDDSWLGNLMDTTLNRPILEQACYAVACMASFACGKDSGKLWDHFKLTFIPAIVNKCCILGHHGMLGAAASAISRITKYAASSPDQIEYLVLEGCLWALFYVNRIRDNKILWSSLIGIEIILEAGDVVEGRRKPKHNVYAKLIDDFEYGWGRLIADKPYYNHETTVKAKNILRTYRPHLLRHYDWWYDAQYDMEASEDESDESDESDDNDESDDDDDDDMDDVDA